MQFFPLCKLSRLARSALATELANTVAACRAVDATTDPRDLVRFAETLLTAPLTSSHRLVRLQDLTRSYLLSL